MSSCLCWTTVDEHGDNPTGQAGNFEFRIWYELNFGDEDFTAEPTVNILSVECAEVCFDDQQPRTPTEEEQRELNDWFENGLDCNAIDVNAITKQAFEDSYVEYGGDNWLD